MTCALVIAVSQVSAASGAVLNQPAADAAPVQFGPALSGWLDAPSRQNVSGGSGADSCRSARKGLAFYLRRANDWRERMGAGQKPRGASGSLPKRIPSGPCPHVRRLAEIARWKAYVARYRYEHLIVRLRKPEAAIRFVFGPYAEQALTVAKCESGWSMTPRAHNGQYLGTFQMGEYARAKYGHGPTALEQAKAAYRYFKASGRDWSPWSCRP